MKTKHTINFSGTVGELVSLLTRTFDPGMPVIEATFVVEVDVKPKHSKELEILVAMTSGVAYVERIEEKLDIVRDFVKADRKIDAIKKIREISGLGLADAKAFVERCWP